MTSERVGDVVVEADGPVLRATIDRPEARNAISPSVIEGLEAAVRLHRALTPARSRWLLLSGEMVSGREAAEWGLVTRAVPSRELDDVAESMIARLASRSAAAVAGMKEMIAAVRDIPVPDGIDAERRIFTQHMAKSDDMRAALARFLQPKENP